jgi:hypothetical protein
MRFFSISLFVAAVMAAATPEMHLDFDAIEARDLEGRATCYAGRVFCCVAIKNTKCVNGREYPIDD